MSGGQQWGTAIGTVAGFFLPGGPSVWGAIGGMVGGAIDPERIHLPGIGDAQQQTAQAGIPRPVVYGHPAPFAGNIIDGEGKARKIKVKDKGKGGPTVYSEKFLLTYAIRICEGPIAGVLRIWRNGELVYDARTAAQIAAVYGETGAVAYTAEQRAKSAAFKARCRIYLGAEDQLPDPALEAIHGVGNTPYYRGTAYIVIEDDDVTQMGGAAAQYQFEVAAAATTATNTESSLVVAPLSGFVNAEWPLAGAESDYQYTGSWVAAGGDGFTSPLMNSISEVRAYFANMHAKTGATGTPNALGSPDIFIGYAGISSTRTGSGESAPYDFDQFSVQPDVTDLESLLLLYQWIGVDEWVDAAVGAFCPIAPVGGKWYGTRNGAVAHHVTSAARDPEKYRTWTNCEPTFIEGVEALCISVTRKVVTPSPEGTPLPDATGYQVMADGSVQPIPTYGTVTGTYKQLAVSALTGTDPTMVYFPRAQGPILALGDPDYDSGTFWTAAYDAAVAAGTMPAGLTYPGNYPVAATSALLSTSTATTVDPTAVTLRSVVEDIAGRCDVPAGKLNAAALTDIIPGYLIAGQATGADCLRPTQQMFFYDLPEVDGPIVAVKRGGALAATITDDDMLASSDDEEETRPQQLEYPAKVSVVTQDPAAEYAPVPQTSIRSSINVNSTSEVTIQSPIPFGGDDAAKRAQIIHKVMFAQAEGRKDFALPEEYSYLVPSDCIEHAGKRWLIEKKDSADGENRLECVYDRASAYTSTATGSGVTAPTLPGTGLRGPTTMVAMNLPALRTEDSAPGMYVAVHGLLPDWAGCALYLSVDGGVTEQPVRQISNAATMGHLTAGLAVAGTTLSVDVRGELESVSAAQIAAKANAFAIVSAGKAEIGQFQTATLVTDGATVDAYNLTTLTRGLLGTAAAAHLTGDRFVLLDASVYFVPIDAIHSGKTLIFRAVTLGTDPANNATFSAVYTPADIIIDGGGA